MQKTYIYIYILCILCIVWQDRVDQVMYWIEGF